MKNNTYEELMSNLEPSERGKRYEAIVKILHLYKALPKEFQYSKININYLSDFLDSNVSTGPDGGSDITFYDLNGDEVYVSIKHTQNFDPIHEGGISQLSQDNKPKNLGYICRDKSKVFERLRRKKSAYYRKIYQTIILSNRLLDEQDILKAYKKFQCSNLTNDYVQEHYLKNPRCPITIHYHQQLALDEFIGNMPHEPNHLLSYVPRTGKSIIILLMVKWILENKLSDRILLITPICKTIDSFEEDIKKYADFSSIPVYFIKREGQPVPSDFTGLVISSIQYFKVGSNKTVEGYQTVISDEAHIGTYTVNSLDNIFRASTVRYRIFASGTPCGTQSNFHIPSKCVYTWTNVHSKLMLSNDGRRALGVPSGVDIEYYKQVPTQVYMPVSINSKTLLEYNELHPGSEKGFSWQSLLALKDPKNYESGFVIQNLPHGTKFLKKMLRTIINDDPNDDSSIYSRTRVLRSIHGSRNFEDLKELVIVFLPTHTNEGTIDNIQQALVKFCETHGVWEDWKILYDNSHTSKFNIDKVMKDTDAKRFVLFLGTKNTVGVTYEKCDLSVHLDTSKSTDVHIQKLARAGTGQPGKTIYVNADYNIQRKTETIASVLTMSREVLKTEDNISTVETLHTTKTFIIDSGEVGYESIVKEINSTYDVSIMIKNITWNTKDLDNLLSMSWTITDGEDFEGTGTDVPTGERDPPERTPPEPREPTPKHNPEEINEVVNKTHQLLQNFVIPIGCILSAKYNEKNAIMKYQSEFMELLCDKEHGIKKEHQYIVMKVCSTCRENNKQLIENIEQRFIDARGDFREYHELIYKHLKPSEQERKKNAEIHTPPVLIREMLDKIPNDFWSEPREVLDPCCGKGGFLVELFHRFDQGLASTYPKKKQRHKIIIEFCLHFWDISPLNVFLTQEILRVMSEGVSTKYNTNVGDSLIFINNKKFDLIVGNPPYNNEFDTVKGGGPAKPIYHTFTVKLFEHADKLLFIVPTRWSQMSALGMKSFKKFMLSSGKMRILNTIEQKISDKLFTHSNSKKVEIKGGVCYFLLDNHYHGPCMYNNIMRDFRNEENIIDNKYLDVFSKINKNNFEPISTLITRCSQVWNIKSNDKRLSDFQEENMVPCYVNKQSGLIKYIRRTDIPPRTNKWKVITSEAYNSGNNIGLIYVAHPDTVVSQSYHMIEFDTYEEAESCACYLDTYLVRYLVCARKVSQHLNPYTFEMVPKVPFTHKYSDEDIYNMFGIDCKMRKDIEMDIKKTNVTF
jgi:site-specific DNA-methyltransferase (adenine-specific)